MLKAKLQFFWAAIIKPAWRAILGVYAVLGLVDQTKDYFVPLKIQERWHIQDIQLPWGFWVTGFLLIILIAVVDHAHGQVSERDACIRATNKRNESLRERVDSAQWMNLADRFKAIDSSVRADWSHSAHTGEQDWRIAGALHREECASLCRLAGAMLLRSPNVVATLDDAVRGQHDDLHRWLYYLKSIDKLKNYNHGVEKFKNGEEYLLEFASIAPLGSDSSLVCMECAAHET